ncbi:GGDEF domain-containing protein [Peloplasma aerotolerans]|uniref:GGDEF domain-containing protein n=1 Tax=Peloplasma aerotolerans TaxID=3044389 RepID=A0AAW6UBK6_9MOLU|nr:GGDEF domain-containing protein [Mariniplasma sp. M4Ah]MDI6452323.1 GGDEF domain-containing protein [Mariniplasma sp. M4Ah]
MKDLLIRISELGIIQKKYVDEFNCIGPNNHSIFSMFDDKTVDQLQKTMKQHKKVFEMKSDFCNAHVWLYLRPAGGQFFLFMTNKLLSNTSKKTFLNMLDALVSEYLKNTLTTADSTQSLFENMQRLNNELLNKSRQIEKMNQQLNKYNTLLNDRLVSDPLTSLVSRYQYRDEIMLAVKNNPNKKGVFMFIDIDDFKDINDSYGHSIGDQYLVEFANRLKSLPFSNSVKMRIAGDEFGIFLYNLDELGKSFYDDIWETFKTEVIHPIKISDIELDLAISLGFAEYPKDSDEIHVLIDQADDAMYNAKKSGKNRYFVYRNQED